MKHTNKSPRPKYSILQNIIFLLKEIAGTYPFLFFLILIEMILSVISPLLGIWLPSLAAGLITEQADRITIFIKLGGFGLLYAAISGIQQMASEGKYFMYNSMRPHFQFQLFFHSLYCDYKNIESKEGLTKYQRAMDTLFSGDWSGTSRMLVSTIAIFTSIVCFLIYSGILTTLHPFIVLLLASLSLFNLFLTKKAQAYDYRFQDQKAGLNQKLDYVEWTARDIHYGKDIRLYNMSDWFIETRESLTERVRTIQTKISRRYFLISSIGTLLSFLQNVIIYGYLIYSTLSGRIDVPEFVLYFGAITGFSNFFNSITMHFAQLSASNLQMNDMRAFLDTTNEPEPENPAALPDTNHLEIEFNHVSFSYDDAEEPVLNDFCLHINAGEKIALVGINGAGKTTLIKLLCGLYRPTQGTIRINNIDISQFRKKDLFSLFSAISQDVYIAPHTVAENVSMKIEDETDMNRVRTCLEKAGLLDTIQSYPDSIHSFMTKAVHDGIQLSGGQQQKLLMARALYKNAPVMILDEPTAALDPIAESEIYEGLNQIAEQKTVIFISHRLASTRFCDKIVLLQDGSVLEAGTHEQLMQKGGSYANMFELQSHYYQKEGESCETSQSDESNY